MSVPPATQRAIEWMEEQLAELSGIRNATARDPSFKNWRQATLTVMQRIWPGDQDRSERFRRIPFSPADPRADARALREWYSRGCQEAARVINGFITEIRENGVPESGGEVQPQVAASDFEDGFPTVDLPAGDLGASSSPADITDNLLAAMADVPPQGSDPQFPEPPRLPVEPQPVAAVPAPTPEPTFVAPPEPAPTPAPVAASAAGGVEVRPAKKGIGMKARLRDLLGFAHLSAKALAGFPPDTTPEPAAPPPAPAQDPVFEMQALGDEVVPAPLPPPPPLAEPSLAAAAPKPEWPVLPLHAENRPPAAEAQAPPPAQPPATTASTLPPAAVEPIDTEPRADEVRDEPAASVIMSKPTTLRGKVEKVSIESLISPEFRNTGSDDATAPDAPPSAPPPPESPESDESYENAPHESPASGEFELPPGGRPALKLVRSYSDEPEFAIGPEPEADTPEPVNEAPEPPAPTPPTPRAPARGEKPAAPASGRITPLPTRATPPPEPVEESAPAPADTPRTRGESEVIARATEDFMRTSPVLGATSRRAKRGREETGFGDPDAIAVASMATELARMDVPEERQPEVRARLLDLARRLERGDLEWGSLRKAVWFAMEYPEVARRLMPVLLPWIDRAS